MKIVIAGGRDFEDCEFLCNKINHYTQNLPELEIVCGKAKGADALGERYAKENGINIKYFPVKWDELGKSAGYIRNSEMANYADGLIAFWDGNSKGTKHMIDLAKRMGLKVKVVEY
ncbi:MAG: DUF2493 domain-containing protein [Anaerovoracaceae bacterium]